ncbi:hypothetical protein GOODEAATRI_034290, partial [Goodea atripinnis]
MSSGETAADVDCTAVRSSGVKPASGGDRAPEPGVAASCGPPVEQGAGAPLSLGLGLYASDAACGWRRRQALTRNVTVLGRGTASLVPQN